MKNFPAKCGAEMWHEPLSEAQLAEFEENLGTRLPKDYRDFLLEWNGVRFMPPDDCVDYAVYQSQPIGNHTLHTQDWADWRPHDKRWSYMDGRRAGVLSLLFGLPVGDTFPSLTHARSYWEFEHWADQRFLPIGQHELSDCGVVCMSLSGDDLGNLYEWHHPSGFPDPVEVALTLENMAWLAPSFREFWDVLRTMSLDEWEEWGG